MVEEVCMEEVQDELVEGMNTGGGGLICEQSWLFRRNKWSGEEGA